MAASKIHPVILSGGSGSRLWPISRALYPKQLLPIAAERSMIQETVARVADHDLFADPIIICNEEHRFLVAEQMRELGVAPHAIVLEPTGRNTAPAAAVAALLLEKMSPDAQMLLLPSDHVIRDKAAFLNAVTTARDAATARNLLLTFGMAPTRPETGYGYIERGKNLAEDAVFQVASFQEKPDQSTAENYVKTGRYYWNSGMFLMPAPTLLCELEKFAPDILTACRAAIAEGGEDMDFFRLGKQAFESCPSDSIDYAVMERTNAAAVVPADLGWSDVGSWQALWELSEKDADGNTLIGDVMTMDLKNAYIRSDDRMVAAIGLEDVIIVATKDAVLATKRDRAQDVKEIVDALKRTNRNEHMSHTRVYRPWGAYETIDDGHRFQVKRIVVKPGAQLSLQMHHHRAEHWVVVQGTAKVTRGDNEFLLEENQSTFIPLGTTHRLENPGKVPLHLIEVQSGAYLGEDDIVRYDDHYGRR